MFIVNITTIESMLAHHLEVFSEADVERLMSDYLTMPFYFGG
jgi:hypothetical protein